MKSQPVVIWFVLAIGSIFGAEFLIMALFSRFHVAENIPASYALDAILLCLMVTPALYVFSLRPTLRLVDSQADMLRRLRLAAKVFDNGEDGIMITDGDGVIVQVNPAFTRITGYTSDEVVGRKSNVLKSGRHDDAFYADMWHQLLTEGRWLGEVWNRKKDGTVFPESLLITAVHDDDGKVVNYAAMFTQGFHDRLTGLPNRHVFADRVEQALLDAERNGEGLALVFIDLDGFKVVNDVYGHDAGDEVLQSTARILRSTIRRNDIPGRLGGDEFVVVLRGVTDRDDVIAVLNKLLAQPPTHSPDRGPQVPVSYSIGFCLWPRDGATAAELITHADEAMYVAKRSGKNTWREYAGPEDRRRLDA